VPIALSNVCSLGKSGRIRNVPLFPLVTHSGHCRATSRFEMRVGSLVLDERDA
jgi:hypothetical protein